MNRYRKAKHAKNQSQVFRVVLTVLIVATVGFIMFNSCMRPEASWEFSNAAGGAFAPILQTMHGIAVSLFGWTGSSYITDYDAFVRKTAHLLEYALLGCECTLLAAVDSKRIFSCLLWMAACVPLITATVDEFIQSFVGRTSMVGDVVLDFAGSLCGMVLALLVSTLILSIDRRRQKGHTARKDFSIPRSRPR